MWRSESVFGDGLSARPSSASGLELTLRVRTRLNLVQELHVGDVVHVDTLLQDDDQSPSIELDGEDGGGERQLANGGLALLGEEVQRQLSFVVLYEGRQSAPLC